MILTAKYSKLFKKLKIKMIMFLLIFKIRSNFINREVGHHILTCIEIQNL